MRNRGRRRGTPRAVNRTDLTVAERMKKQKPMSQLESNDSPRPQDYNQPEVLSIRWKKPRGAVVIHLHRLHTDYGSRYEGGVDNEERRHGNGVYILRSGHVSDGGWVHGYFEGFGMQTFATTGDCHEGLYRKNYRHGTGTFLWANGDKYVGNWRAGKMHGTGTFFWKNGDFYDVGMMHGKGKKILSSGEMINGAWRQNQVSGWGIEVFSYGDKYEGFFVKGEREGFVSTNGWAETCMKVHGRMHGIGVYVSAGGFLHGSWLSDELSGQGVHYFQCGSVYTGEYKAGERSGVGTLTFASGEVYEGEWHKDEIHGCGSWSSPDGRKFIGTWNHGFPFGRGIFCHERDEDEGAEDEGGGHIAETKSV